VADKYVRGIRDNIPAPGVIGRLSGSGAAYFIPIQNLLATLKSFGAVTGNATPARSSRTGFGFFTSSRYLAGELLGEGIFTVPVSFPLASPASICVSGVAATGTAVLNIKVGGSVVGTITFPPGGKTGVIVWSASPYVLPTNTPIQLYAPASADASLSFVTGLLLGSSA